MHRHHPQPAFPPDGLVSDFTAKILSEVINAEDTPFS